MTIDKRMKYEMQGGSKPARNYLGSQKTVSGIPVKWKSGPDAPSTELAYITKAEKDLLLKKNLHGSLKNGPNTGPDGIMSLDSQGDYSRDRSPQGRSRQGQAQHDAQMKSILTGQKNIGQTTKTGPKTRKYAVPEYVKVKQPGGGYKDKYIGSGYKSYGTPSFFGNLFSRGAPGYRGIKGMPAFFGKAGFETRGTPGGPNFGYYSDKENFGETRDALPNFGIMGLIQGLVNKFKKPPQDMSEFNKLTLGGTHPAALDFNPDAKIQDTSFSEQVVTPERYPNSIGPNKYGVQTNNLPFKSMVDMAAENKNWFDSVDEGVVPGNRTPLMPDASVLQGSVIDKKPSKGIMQMISDAIFSPAGAAEIDFSKLSQAQDKFTPDFNFIEKAAQGVKDYTGATKQDYVDAVISGAFGNTAGATSWDRNVGDLFEGVDLNKSGSMFSTTPTFVSHGQGTGSGYIDVDEGSLQKSALEAFPGGFFKAKGGRVGYADGGLATLFTRRG